MIVTSAVVLRLRTLIASSPTVSADTAAVVMEISPPLTVLRTTMPSPPVAETESLRSTVMVPEPSARMTAVPPPEVMVFPAVDVRTTLPVASASFWSRTIARPADDRMSPLTVTLIPPEPAPPVAVTSSALEVGAERCQRSGRHGHASSVDEQRICVGGGAPR